MWVGKYLSLILLVLLLSVSVPSVLPSRAALIVEDVLVNDTSIYLVTGNTWHFYQGYNFTVKSVSQETNSAWLELSLGNRILQSEILKEGDSFTYNKDQRTIFNITVNTIYVGAGQDLVAFAPVFQYADQDLPQPVLPEDKTNQGQNSSLENELSKEVNGIEGFRLHTALPVIAVTATLMLLLRKKRY